MLRLFSGFLIVVLCAANPTTAPRASAQSAEDIYERGTDIGMLYLSEHSGRLRVTLLLQECGFGELASTVGTLLSNTLQFFVENHSESFA